MGNVSSYKVKQVKNFLDKKLHVCWSDTGKELKGWYWLDGKKALPVYVPHQHGGGHGDSLSYNVLRNVRNNLKVTTQEFDDLYKCPMSGPDYDTKVRSMGLP